MPENELQEVVLVDEKKTEEAPKENPAMGLISESRWREMTQGVTAPALVGGLGGAFATGVIPVLIKWDAGWKGIVSSLVVTFGGGFVIGRFNKVMGYGWVLGGGIVTIIKALRMVVVARPELKLLGDGIGEDLIYGQDDYAPDYYTEEELFGIGEDPIIPTADVGELGW